ncbi:MAG TPA: tyrosine-type recombinase/integrase [Pedococcus sp.]|nr:tyrosine-type recombinase/integrase [Pedococcus sp.]
MKISDIWHLSRSHAIAKAKADGVTSCSCKGNLYPSKYHLRGMRWQVIPRNGEPRRSFKLKTDAEAYVKRLVEGVEQAPAATEAASIRFADYGQIVIRRTPDPNTRRSRLGHLNNHLIPVFGNMTMSEEAIRTRDVVNWLADLRVKPRNARDPRPLHGNTVKLIWDTLVLIMRNAVNIDKLRTTNPCDDIKRPKRVRHAITTVWESELVDQLLDTVNEIAPEHYPIPLVAAMCGLRQGEAFAVSTQDFDLSLRRRKLTVRHQVGFDGVGRLYLKPPKAGRVREVPLPVEVSDVLIAHNDRYETLQVPCSCCPNQQWDLLFPWNIRERGVVAKGGALAPRLIDRNEWNRKVWHWALKLVGLPLFQRNGLHQLRHSFVSEALARGATIRQIQAWVGHASAAFTLSIYAHILDRTEADAHQIMGGRMAERTRRHLTVEGEVA